MAKRKRLKTVRAGRLVFGVCYTQALASDAPKARTAKSKCSSEARRRLNFRAAWQKLRLLLCCNFSRGDLYVTLTYDDAHLPASRKDAKKAMQNFIDRVRAARKAAGESFKYVYVTEELVDNGRARRLHHHMILNTGGERGDFELIRSLWSGGSNIEILHLGKHSLYSDDFLELAQYLCKERNPDAKTYNVGDRCWCASRNLARPQVVSEAVDDNVTICAPPGAQILDSDHKQNEYGSFDYLVYLLPEQRPKRPPTISDG